MPRKINAKAASLDIIQDCPLLRMISDDIMLCIFQQLDAVSLAKTSCVCRKWYNLTLDKTLTKHFDLRLKPLPLKQLWNLLWRKLTPFTTSVHLRGISKPNRPIELLSIPFLRDLKKRCPHLQNLSLEFFDFRSIPLHSLPSDLQFLSLRGSMLTLGWFDDLKSCLTLTKLTYLDLRDCTKLCNSDLESLSYLSSVEELYLVNCYRISARGIPSITAGMKNLKTVDLSSCPAVNNVVLYYLSRLNLVNLRLRFCHLITDDGVKTLLSKNMSNTLRSLDLFTCHELTDLTLKFIIENTVCLKLLDIGGNYKFTQEKVKEVESALSSCYVKYKLTVSVTECLYSQINYDKCCRNNITNE